MAKADQSKVIQFVRVRDVKAPNRANPTDAGTDWFVPEYNEDFLKDLIEANALNDLEISVAPREIDGKPAVKIVIPAHEQVKIPSGIKVWILNKNTYIQATNKSGVATKLHCVVGADTVDADYQGEVHINLLNVGSSPITLVSGQKVVQFIHKEYIDTQWQEITLEDYNKIPTTSRGAGGHGSTGNF